MLPRVLFSFGDNGICAHVRFLSSFEHDEWTNRRSFRTGGTYSQELMSSDLEDPLPVTLLGATLDRRLNRQL